MQSTNWFLERAKAWQTYNRLWQGIPLDYGQGKDWIFIEIPGSMELMDCYWVAISWKPGFGLCIFWHGNCQKPIYNAIEETKIGICPSLFQCPPAEILQHCSDTVLCVVITAGGPSCSSALHFLYLEYIFLSVWIPNGGSILQLGTYESVVGSLSHPGEFCFYISFEKAQGTVGISGTGNSVYVDIPRQASRDIIRQVSSAGHSFQDLSM